MTVIQLECFMEVNRTKNFSRAAANLYLSQPTLSRYIQTLEEELRARLFIRANNTVQLTAVGQALYPTLKELCDEIQRATAEMHEIVDRHTGLFRIGIAAGLCPDGDYQNVIHTVKKQHTTARVQVCHLKMSEIYSALMGGSVDVLLALDAFMPHSDKVHSYPLYTDRMCLAVPASHPNSRLTTIEHSQISQFFPDLDLYLLDANEFEPDIRNDLVDNYDLDASIVKVPFSDFDMEDIMLMVDCGLGVTCINESSDLALRPGTCLIPEIDRTPEGDQRRTVTIAAYWLDKNYSPILKTFLSTLKRSYPAEHE